MLKTLEKSRSNSLTSSGLFRCFRTAWSTVQAAVGEKLAATTAVEVARGQPDSQDTDVPASSQCFGASPPPPSHQPMKGRDQSDPDLAKPAREEEGAEIYG